MDKEQLLKIIEDSFAGVSRKGGISLHETEAIDNYACDDERAAARAKDRDASWQDIPHKDLAEVCGIGGVNFFDVIGWRYYLPAYMTWFLKGGSQADSIATESIFWTLTNHKRTDTFNLERFESLSDNQAFAVAEFLKFVSESVEFEEWHAQDAEKAYASYWSKFTT